MEQLEKNFKVAPEADERSKNNEREIESLREEFEEYKQEEEKKAEKTKQNIRWLIGGVGVFVAPHTRQANTQVILWKSYY